jgi:hypothetical protein
LKSKIINMAEKIRDPEDVLLEDLFAAEAIADDGFSERIVARIRRRNWLRRGAFFAAISIGGAVAFRPAAEIVSLVYRITLELSTGLFGVSTDWIPSLTMMLAGGVLFAATMLALRIVED